MSILIEGMEMPKYIEPGLVIEFADGIDGKRYARLYHYQHGGLTEWLEAVPVPELHGDLIDRGYAIATACSGRIRTLPTTEDGENWIRVEEVRESIKNAPPVIPASEGKT